MSLCVVRSAGRGRRHPAGAHAVAQKSPPPEAACREVHLRWRSADVRRWWQQRRVRVGRGARGGRREGEQGHNRSGGPDVPCERPGLLARRGLQGQGFWPRAQRASSTDSWRLFERSERSEQSEFGHGPGDRRTEPGHKQSCGVFVPGDAPSLWLGEGSLREARAASVARRGLPGRAFAAQTRGHTT